jgi:hypothetical protein
MLVAAAGANSVNSELSAGILSNHYQILGQHITRVHGVCAL